MNRRVRAFLFVDAALATCLLAPPAFGDALSREPTAQGQVHRARSEWTVTADAYIAVNPTWWNVAAAASLGFGDEVGDERRFALTLDVEANSSYTTPALSLEWTVTPFLAMGIEYRGFAFYGRDGALLNFGDPKAPYGDDAIDALIDTPAETAGYGQRFALSEKVRVDTEHFVVAAQGALALYNLAQKPGVYLDWETDKLVREVDGVFLLRAAALWRAHRSHAFEVFLGPYAETTAAGRTQLVRQRLGGLVATRLFDTVRFGVAAGVNALDPNRQGQGFAVLDLGLDLPEL